MQSSTDSRTRVLLLGPRLEAVSGVSTHLNQLFGSALTDDFDLAHFQVGSEGHRETTLQKFRRLMFSPLFLGVRIMRERPDIVHINASLDHKSFPRDALYLAVALALRRKVVFQVHGGELPQDLYASPWAYKHFVTRVLRAPQAVAVLAKSEFRNYSKIVPKDKLRLIANAVHLDPQVQFPEAPVRGPLRLVFVGRLVREKGVADCIAAASLLRESGRDFKLTIAGSGPEEAALIAQAEILIRENRVEFAGAVFGAAKNKLFRDSHISLSPTFHREGLPYALLESMASGTVPITTRVGAQPDVIEAGVHGLFVEPADPQALYDAIVRLDDDRQLLLSIAQQAIRRIRDQFTVERLGAEFGELYRSVT